MKKIEILKKFIVDNNLQFTEGRRNSDCTILSGFALSISATLNDCADSINEDLYDRKLKDELDRVYNYADLNSYGTWWSTEDARKLYTF